MADQYDAQPEITIDLATTYQATLHTSQGDISIEFYPADAPQTVNNFIFLAREGFYDGVIFHRTISGFMVQGGDPTGTGTGGPGYTFRDEFHSKTSYPRGIVHEDAGLPNAYTIFGHVTEGMDVVDALATAPSGPQDRPHDPVAINSVTITEG